jgi:GntR family transcriptional repressor for pyruvate dehydrogenase complex
MFENMKFDRSTVSTKIVEEIKSLILGGELIPGEKLPSERDLSQQFNVSRNTIRESYKILTTLGFIEIKHGQGAFVADGANNLSQLTDQYFIRSDQFTDLFEMRRLIETHAVVWSIERASDEQVDELYQFVKETVMLVNQNKLTESMLSNRDHRFHIKIAELSNNAIVFRIMNSLTGLFNNVRYEASKIPDRINHSWIEHLEIVEMMLQRNSDKAKEYMEKHLQSVEQTLKEELKGGGSI